MTDLKENRYDCSILPDFVLRRNINDQKLVRLPSTKWLDEVAKVPTPAIDTLLSQVEACSVDLTIGTIFSKGEIKRTGYVTLQPGDVISLFTFEELDLPPNLCATAFPLNSQSSRGLLVLNPGHVDPGWKGPLTVRAMNLKKTEMVVSIGQRIFTVIFQRLMEEVQKPYEKSPPDREQYERNFNSMDVETTPDGLSGLVLLDKNTPFITESKTKELIVRHWMSWTPIILVFVAILISTIAFLVQINSSGQEDVGTKIEATEQSLERERTEKVDSAPSDEESVIDNNVDSSGDSL